MPPAQRWTATRPGDFVPDQAAQPAGDCLGTPGPDQGYALHLARRFNGRVKLRKNESWHDVEAGCVGIAMRRAALFGRAPVVFDLEVAFGIWGFLDDAPPPDLVAERTVAFEAAGHDYWVQRAIADRIPESSLRLKPADIHARLSDWRSLVGA